MARGGPYDYKRAWNYALWLLGRQAYPREQLRERLARKEVAPDDIERVLARLDELGFVDDETYALSYVRSRRTRKGPRALRQELRRKGVGEEETDTALASFDPEEQLRVALELLRKNAWRFRKAKDGDDGERKRRERSFAFLARRGFGSEVAVRAIEEAEGEA